MPRVVPPPRYLRFAQVAALLHVSPKTVTRWAAEGKLPFRFTLGGHRRFDEAEIRAIVEENTVRPSAEARRPRP